MITSVIVSYYNENRIKKSVRVGKGRPFHVSYIAGSKEAAIAYGLYLLAEYKNYKKGRI